MTQTPPLSDFGLVGLAVMGQNLVLNVESRGFSVSVTNRSPEVTEAFVARHPGKRIVGKATLAEFVASLTRPRKVMLMVKAGAAVDAVIEQLIPLLEPDDIVIDGGNSLYTDTERRDAWLRDLGLRFIGAGVSGGEEVRARGRRSCPAGRPRPGRRCGRSSRRSPPGSTASRAWCTSAPGVPATT